MDSQQVEIVGRNTLVASLVAGGVEVARPERDRGVDLIAYLDDDLEAGRFIAVPIQVKAAQTATFSIHHKYEKFPGMLVAFIWNALDAHSAVIYALTHAECLAIAGPRWISTSSWTVQGAYVTNRPSARLRAALEPYRMTSAHWRERIRYVGSQA